MIELAEFDVNCYVTSVFSDGEHEKLEWTSGPGTGAMVIRCPYKVYPFDQLPELIEKISSTELIPGRFNEIMGCGGERFAVRILSPEDRIREAGCRNVPSAFSYVVLAFKGKDNGGKVYLPGTNPDPEYGRKQQLVDVPVVVRLTYSREVERQRKLFRGETERYTGFFFVDTNRIPRSLAGRDYQDGDIYYTVGGFRVPITRRMLDQEVFIEAEHFPTFFSGNEAISIVTEEV